MTRLEKLKAEVEKVQSDLDGLLLPAEVEKVANAAAEAMRALMAELNIALKERDEARKNFGTCIAAGARIETERNKAQAELARVKERLSGTIQYGIDLQRIIEDLCENRTIRKPESGAMHHYEMAARSRGELEAPLSSEEEVETA